MLIGISGAPCSGKNELINYLVDRKFVLLDYCIDLNSCDEECCKCDKCDKCDRSNIKYFNSCEKIIDYATKNWQSKLVVNISIFTQDEFKILYSRPFFLYVNLYAPTMIRYKRYLTRKNNITLDEFVELSDKKLIEILEFKKDLNTHVEIFNGSTCLKEFYKQLDKFLLFDQWRLRPTWDDYFIELTYLASRRSNCMKRRVGCVLVSENRIIATGYNGTPKGVKNCSEGGCPRCNSGQSTGVGLGTCLCLHAEENTLLEAGRNRVFPGSILYCTTCPCLTCSIKIVQMGIKEVVYSQDYAMDSSATNLFTEANVILRKHTLKSDRLMLLD